jgi:hypothetical protein
VRAFEHWRDICKNGETSEGVSEVSLTIKLRQFYFNPLKLNILNFLFPYV